MYLKFTFYIYTEIKRPSKYKTVPVIYAVPTSNGEPFTFSICGVLRAFSEPRGAQNGSIWEGVYQQGTLLIILSPFSGQTHTFRQSPDATRSSSHQTEEDAIRSSSLSFRSSMCPHRRPEVRGRGGGEGLSKGSHCEPFPKSALAHTSRIFPRLLKYPGCTFRHIQSLPAQVLPP